MSNQIKTITIIMQNKNITLEKKYERKKKELRIRRTNTHASSMINYKNSNSINTSN